MNSLSPIRSQACHQKLGKIMVRNISQSQGRKIMKIQSLLFYQMVFWAHQVKSREILRKCEIDVQSLIFKKDHFNYLRLN